MLRAVFRPKISCCCLISSEGTTRCSYTHLMSKLAVSKLKVMVSEHAATQRLFGHVFMCSLRNLTRLLSLGYSDMLGR